MKNKKGFTLVELLAVIVVLAIIMIIAIPSVLNSMDDARKSSFALYGQKLINSAQAKVQASQLTNTTVKTCYNISELIDGATGSYQGKVEYNSSDKSYKVTLRDNSFVISAATATQLESAKSATAGEIGDTVTAGTLYNYDSTKLGSKVTFTCAS